MSRTLLFGPDRVRPGYPETEWSVWITGMDDVLDQPDLTTALMVAAEHNAIAVHVRDTDSALEPVTHAVVLHHGHAWQRPKPVKEQAGPLVLSLVYEVRCDLCGYVLDEEGEGTQCFATEARALEAALDQGWTQLTDGRVLCHDDLDEDHLKARADNEAAKPGAQIPGQIELPT